MKTYLLAIVMAVLLAPRAEGRTWTVGQHGADFPLIAPAIAAAADGDTVVVRGGVYREDLVLDRRVRLIGTNGPVLFGTGVGSVVTILAPGAEVGGFTIEGSGTGQTNEMDAAVQIRANDVRVVGNRMRRVFYGVVIVNGTRNEIADNEIRGFADLPFGRRGDGIYLYRSPGNLVARNRISGERDGIYFQYAPLGRALDNAVWDSRYGLHDMFSDDTIIAGNAFGDSVVGANIMNSRRIRLERNRIERNRGVPGIGLTLKDCDDSTVTGNQIAGNARGLLLEGSSNNTFADNAFHANDTAITLFSSAERNAFGGNELVDNWSDVVLSGRDSGTRWSVDGRGNYWTRYRGFDFDGDGIGDAPHPMVGAFERLEGANAAVRLFLQSPAAAGLELAARLGVRAADDATDDRPLVRRPSTAPAQPRRAAHPLVASSMLALAAAVAAVMIRGASPCSH